MAASVNSTAKQQLGQIIEVPGGSMGKNGAVRVRVVGTATNNANVKTITLDFGALSAAVAVTSAAAFSLEFYIGNKNDFSLQNLQGVHLVGTTDSIAAAVAGTVNTGSDVNLTLSATLATGTDVITILRYEVEVIPNV